MKYLLNESTTSRSRRPSKRGDSVACPRVGAGRMASRATQESEARIRGAGRMRLSMAHYLAGAQEPRDTRASRVARTDHPPCPNGTPAWRKATGRDREERSDMGSPYTS